MRRALEILALILVCAAGPAAAQEIFELPVELELPASPLALQLDDAIVDVLLEPRSMPVLRARGLAAEGSATATLVFGADGGGILVRREDGEEPGPRLRVELVLDPQHWLSLRGSDLDVGVQAQPIEATLAEDDDDDGDDGKDGEDGEDDEDDEDDEERDDAAQGRRLTIEVEASSLQLTGVQSAGVTAVDSYLHAIGTGGDLAVTVEGGSAEILEHRGTLVLTGRDAEVVVNEFHGRIDTTLAGGSLLARNGVGQLESQLDGAWLRLEGWRGRLQAEGSGSRIEARALQGVRLDLQGDHLEIALDGFQGQLQAALQGGRLSASELRGQTVINGRDDAEVALDRFEGSLTLAMQGGSTRLVDLRGQIKASVYDGRLEVEAAQHLDLVAQRAEVVAGRLERLGKVEIIDSQAGLDLTQVQHDPTLTLGGSSAVRVRLRAPCTVKLGEVELLNSQADVIGCELHSQTLRRTRYDSRGLDGQRRVLLSATLGADSTLEVEGVP